MCVCVCVCVCVCACVVWVWGKILGYRPDVFPLHGGLAGLTTSGWARTPAVWTPYPAPSGGQVSAGLGQSRPAEGGQGVRPQSHSPQRLGPETLGPEAEIAPVERVSS